MVLYALLQDLQAPFFAPHGQVCHIISVNEEILDDFNYKINPGRDRQMEKP
jgi:hypothetical protein